MTIDASSAVLVAKLLQEDLSHASPMVADGNTSTSRLIDALVASDAMFMADAAFARRLQALYDDSNPLASSATGASLLGTDFWKTSPKGKGRATSVKAISRSIGDIGPVESPVENTEGLQHFKDWRSFVRNPRYRRDFIWDESSEPTTPSVDSTLILPPLPDVPRRDLEHEDVTRTIRSYPRLFKVVTPVDPDKLESLLESHPNRPFVTSVIKGFREGFWPSAMAELLVSVPRGLDNQRRGQKFGHPVMEFLRTQRDIEVALGRYSEPFGSDLLPGMIAQPCFAVPKASGSKFRLINDHSAGQDSLNAAIPSDACSIKPDVLSDLVTWLIAFYRKHGRAPAWLFKSDASSAYRQLPCHPRWQVRQATQIDGSYHVDRCCVFGNRASGAIWCAFYALVLWAGVHVKGIPGLLHYVDDVFSFDPDERLVYYERHSHWYPCKQAALLRLFDEVGIPHDKEKQLYGRNLTILGLHVSLDTMTITMPDEERNTLVEGICDFVGEASGHALRHWQKLLGHCNWALSAYPLLRPALQSSYAAISGTDLPPGATIALNDDTVEDLSWFATRVSQSKGVHFLQIRSWDESDAELTLLTDASESGLAFWTPDLNVAFMAPIHATDIRCGEILFNEALAVVSAIEWAATSVPKKRPRRVLIRTDSMNTVDNFHSLSPKPKYVLLFLRAMEVMMDFEVDVRVVHIPGKENVVADALSRSRFDIARLQSPGLQISSFTPRRNELGRRV